MKKMDHSDESILPNFLIVGTQKAGTSSLFDILNQHSQIYLPPVKEVHFFDRDEVFIKGKAFYANYFSEAGKAKAVGEASPSYLFLPEVPGRIRQTLGDDVKIIIILRNPANRALSHYKMLFEMGLETRSLEEVLEDNLQSIRTSLNYDKATSYLDRGMYAFQLENYFRIFPRENIRIYLFEEDFVEMRKNMIHDIQDFLGLDFENVSTYFKSMPYVSPKNKQIDQMLNTAHPLNQFFKHVIPFKKLRIFIKYHFNKINQKLRYKILILAPSEIN
ncbi:MAG: sulfotransferase [Bacteroidales bacterium]|nr:sulfotransferase [Bacteroidales bacterium]